MNNINGKDRSTIIQAGIIVLIIVSIGFSGYMVNQALEIQRSTDHKIDTFINNWKKRVQISNSIQNTTQDRLLDLANNTTFILQKQLLNEQDILSSEKNILGNLTNHRLVANETNIEVGELANQTNNLIQKFNATNEDERVKAVQRLTNQHEIIINQLNNLTNGHETVNSTGNNSEIAELEKRLEELRQSN